MPLFRSQPLLLTLLFFLSGMAALIYEVLWLKELGLLFGNTSQAAAATLAAFFLGMAAGGAFWGRRDEGRANPLRLYGWLELGVAACAAGYFLLLKLYGWLYPLLFACCSGSPALFVAVKFALSLLVLFPPAFFIGGTLPVMSHFVAPKGRGLGRKVAWLYTVNTCGAVLGTLLAGFCLPPWLGYRTSYLVAITVSVVLAAIAWRMKDNERDEREERSRPDRRRVFTPMPLAAVAFVSGASMLALQVLWVRMFAQVLQNSVYTFALVLAVFLVGLAMGGWGARLLMHSRVGPEKSMFGLIVAGGFAVSVSPFVFYALTDGLHYIGSASGWWGYLSEIFLAAVVVMGPSLILLGAVFPLLVRLAERSGADSGRIVGNLLGVNTIGAVAGALAAGFVVLEYLGMWSGVRLMAVVYFLTAGFWLSRLPQSEGRWLWLPALGIAAAVSVFDTGRLPAVRVDPVNEDESLLETWESSAGTVAVVRRGGEVKMMVNNYYVLGGTAS
ncbi:MAG: fused MFS/spermidine synthase, partial [Gammaproteobacteria bacterium]